jgi:hypothetical protein
MRVQRLNFTTAPPLRVYAGKGETINSFLSDTQSKQRETMTLDAKHTKAAAPLIFGSMRYSLTRSMSIEVTLEFGKYIFMHACWMNKILKEMLNSVSLSM